MGFINLGTRNKGTFWEYVSAYSFLNANLPITKFKVPEFLGAGKGESNQHCHHTNNIKRFKEIFVKEFNDGKYNDKFFKSLISEYYKPFLKIQKIVKKKDFSADTNKQLAKKIDQIAVAIGKTHTPMVMGLYTMYLEEFYTDKLKKIISKRGIKQNEIPILKSILLTTPKKSFVQEEEEYIFEIKNLFLKSGLKKTLKSFNSFCNKSSIKNKLEYLVKNFGWFHMEYSQDPYTIDNYRKDIWDGVNSGIKDIYSPKKAKEEIIKKQNKFFNTYSSNSSMDYFKKLTYALHEFASILDHSKVITVKGIFISRPLFLEISKRLNISLSDMLFLTIPEIKDFLKDNKSADKNIIRERRGYRAVLLEDKKIKVYEGEKAEKIVKRLLPQRHEKKNEQIRGIVIYPGVVKGKVTIINSIKDRNKFKKGDILVSHDGSAELTSFLQQASAIVTDQGGMICHSAIIAREMKTPCIVGTRNATKILKRGDLVEVDANKGFVKVLKR